MRNITDSHTNRASWTLKELGCDTNRDGLGGKAIANLENHSRIAVWDWDLGFGAVTWTGETCERKFDNAIKEQGFVPLG